MLNAISQNILLNVPNTIVSSREGNAKMHQGLKILDSQRTESAVFVTLKKKNVKVECEQGPTSNSSLQIYSSTWESGSRKV